MTSKTLPLLLLVFLVQLQTVSALDRVRSIPNDIEVFQREQDRGYLQNETPTASLFDVRHLSSESGKPRLGQRLAMRWLAHKARKHQADPDQKVPALTITGFIFGVAGLITLVYGIGILLCIGAIIMSAIALRRHKLFPEKKGRGLAVAGLVMGIVGASLALIAFLALLIYLIYYYE